MTPVGWPAATVEYGGIGPSSRIRRASKPKFASSPVMPYGIQLKCWSRNTAATATVATTAVASHQTGAVRARSRMTRARHAVVRIASERTRRRLLVDAVDLHARGVVDALQSGESGDLREPFSVVVPPLELAHVD